MSQAQLLPTEHFSPSVSLIEGRPATTSLAIAEHFGKRHDSVLRDIRRISSEAPENFSLHNFVETPYTDLQNGQSYPSFIVYFDGFILLVMGYTGKRALQIKLLYIAAFNAMRDELAAQREVALPEVPHIQITPSTPTSRKPLRSLVNAWAWISGQHHESLWPQVKAHFQLERIDDLPEEWIPDALEWVQGKIDEQEKVKALPAPETFPAPSTALTFRADFPDDMGSDRKEAMQRMERIAREMHASFGVVRNIVRLGCHPGTQTMRMRPDEREAYGILENLYVAADESLCAAYNALEAGYKLGRLYGRG
ncbi:rha family phage regulatory protein [Desulfovibrio sp. 3_1_syn3]|uniref:Rha family transcriptional regulator n=1 Tax=Desulfovibrio sp. 3_1_syn3 TaxID=457398 RepID=UPI0001E12C30|nr:Rha family transcriptional regulator [Desulfovibrio sp. 3_1_syn3]EFL84945.1 rha family phage regulatory protein [Desulfovibrio sp. 3_1_syn3]